LASLELTARKVVNDNNRLRSKALEGLSTKGEGDQWKDEKIMELEFLVGEYKARNKELLNRTENNGKSRIIPAS
jgi:hypothetical protein